MNGNAAQAAWLWRILTVMALSTGVLAGPPVTTHARTDAPLDLAALILHSDDLDWLVEDLDLVNLEDYPYGMWISASHTTIKEAMMDDMYAPGRGSLNLTGPAGEAVATILEDADWIRTQGEFMVLPEPGFEEEQISLGVGVTIEEFADEDGAEAAFDAFDEEELILSLTEHSEGSRLDAPSLTIDVPAVMWETSGRRWDAAGETQMLWARLDNMIVSVAFYSAGHGLPDNDVIATLLDLQLKRLVHAEHLHQPNTSACAPRFDDDQVLDKRSEYSVLNGQAFPWSEFISYEELADRQATIEAEGVVHSYFTSQRIDDTAVGAYDGTFWFAGRVWIFTDEASAEAYVENTGERLAEEPAFLNIEKIDELPNLGDGAVVYNYDGVDDFPASIITVQVGEMVFSIRLGSMIDYQPESVIELAEAQLDRLDDGACDDALEVPGSLLDSIELPYRQTSQMAGST